MPMQMTKESLEKLINDKADEKINALKASMKGLDEKALADAFAVALKKIEEERAKSMSNNMDTLIAFERANYDASVKGLKKEDAKSIVNQMITSALFAMEKTKKNNVVFLSNDELLASAKEKFPMSKTLHAVIQSKAVEASTPNAGGFTVPLAFSSDYIEQLYANTILDKVGARKIPMPNGNLAIPKMTGSAGASWVGETAPAPKNTPTFGEVNLRAKKLAAMTLVSNSLLRYTGVGLDSWISSDLMEKARIKLDEAFLDGIGSEFTPRGLSHTSGVQTYTGNSGALDVSTPLKMFALLENANVPFNDVKWLLNPIGKSWLASQKFASGPFAWANEIATRKQLNGYDIITSSTVGYHPDASTPANSTADFWLGDFSQFVWGVGYDISIEMSREGTYVDDAGQTVSAFQRDLTIMRLITEHDFACRHPEAFVKATLTEV